MLPVFALALFGLLDVGSSVYTNSALSKAARESARLAATEAAWVGFSPSHPECRSGNRYAPVCPDTAADLKTHVTTAVNGMTVALGPVSDVYISCNSGASGDPAPSGDWTDTPPSGVGNGCQDGAGRSPGATGELVSVVSNTRISPSHPSSHPSWDGPAERFRHHGGPLKEAMMSTMETSRQRGQVLALFALGLTALVLAAAVVVDGGYAFAQRRDTQNAADFAAMAGARIVGAKRINRPAGAGTAAHVVQAVNETLAANDAELENAYYVDRDGASLGSILTAGTIPPGAYGVAVEARTDWQPFLLGVIGIDDWAAGAPATAMTTGESIGGGVLPVGLQDTLFDGHPKCQVSDIAGCVSRLTSGELNMPGGFGWLKFGLQGSGGKCDWTSSLGMVADGGCQSSKPFLDFRSARPRTPTDAARPSACH